MAAATSTARGGGECNGEGFALRAQKVGWSGSCRCDASVTVLCAAATILGIALSWVGRPCSPPRTASPSQRAHRVHPGGRNWVCVYGCGYGIPWWLAAPVVCRRHVRWYLPVNVSSFPCNTVHPDAVIPSDLPARNTCWLARPGHLTSASTCTRRTWQPRWRPGMNRRPCWPSHRLRVPRAAWVHAV